MFEIVNHRYFNNMPLIISSQKHIDEAIGSRIYEMCRDYVASFRGKRMNYRIYGE